MANYGMKVQPTDQFAVIDDRKYRVWKGTACNGTEVLVFVHSVTAEDPSKVDDLSNELPQFMCESRVCTVWSDSKENVV